MGARDRVRTPGSQQPHKGLAGLVECASTKPNNVHNLAYLA